jgi:hypothetical protein
MCLGTQLGYFLTGTCVPVGLMLGVAKLSTDYTAPIVEPLLLL